MSSAQQVSGISCETLSCDLCIINTCTCIYVPCLTCCSMLVKLAQTGRKDMIQASLSSSKL